MSGQPRFVSPFYRPQCLAAAAPAGKAKLTHPGKAILAGKEVCPPLGIKIKNLFGSLKAPFGLTVQMLISSLIFVYMTPVTANRAVMRLKTQLFSVNRVLGTLVKK